MSWIRVDQVLDTLFPSRCLLCGQSGAGVGIPACAGCMIDLPWLEQQGQCSPALGLFAAVQSALIYEYPVDRLVAAAKFGRQVPVARGLGQLLALRMPALAEPPDAVVPVPLHWRREASRGFNQAEEIARALCAVRRWSLRADLCRRIRPTPEQSGLGAAGRRDNLRGAFALSNARAAGRCRHVLLVDDVLTTGATATAVGEIFQAAGVRQLSLWTVARTP
ncbi:MAG: ComF family protein [Gammaproteobacteria bacterium]|nr:ComF family protein [Gammaproteobacteria bacterium]